MVLVSVKKNVEETFTATNMKHRTDQISLVCLIVYVEKVGEPVVFTYKMDVLVFN